MQLEIEKQAEPYIGRTTTETDEVSVTMARRLAATLSLSPDGIERGAPLPDGWHVILFTPTAPTNVLAADGHAPKGDFLPDLPLPRRMFAGRRVIFHQPLTIGDDVERVTTIAKIEAKSGRSGLLAFLTLVHEISSPAGLCLTEEQTLVYREEAKDGGGPAPEPEKAPGDWPWQSTVTPTSPMLFRYSAITFNAHRIHYDETYVREAEGYPERVVNGGLTAILMTEFARSKCSGEMSEFRVRNQRPLFVDRPIALMGRSAENGDSTRTDFWAADSEGYVVSKSSIVWGKGR